MARIFSIFLCSELVRALFTFIASSIKKVFQESSFDYNSYVSKALSITIIQNVTVLVGHIVLVSMLIILRSFDRFR